MPVPARIALIVAAAAAVFVLVSWQRDEDRCTDTVEALFVDLRDEAPDERVDAGIERVEADCHGGLRLIGPAAALFQVGEAERAEAVAREAIRREPESFSAWAALASILRGSDRAASRRAVERARELNPRYRPPS